MRFLPEGRFTRYAKRQAAEMVTLPAPDLQIYGDSVSAGALNVHVHERVLASERRSPSVRNDSIPGTTAYCAYPLLARQAAAGRVPRAILLAYNPRSYTVPLPEKFLGRWATWSEVFDGLKLGIPFESWLASVACRFSFALRYRLEINALIRGGRENWEFFAGEPVPDASRRRAAMPVEPPLPPARPGTVDHNPDFHGVRFLRSVPIDRSLGCFFKLARKLGIRVWIVSMPEPTGAHRLRVSNGFCEAYGAYLDEIAEGGVARLLIRDAEVLPAADFTDGVHLNAHAAYAFSERVGLALRGAGGP